MDGTIYQLEELESTSIKQVTVTGHLGDLGENISTVVGVRNMGINPADSINRKGSLKMLTGDKLETKIEEATVSEPRPNGIFKKSTDYGALVFKGAQWYWDFYVLYEHDNTVTAYRMPGKKGELTQEYRNKVKKAQSDYDNATTFKKVVATGALKVAQAFLNELTDPHNLAVEEDFYDAIEFAVSDFGTGWYYHDGPVTAPAQWQCKAQPAATSPSIAAPAPTQPAAAPSAGGFCGNCGAPIKPGSKFCTSCGAKL